MERTSSSSSSKVIGRGAAAGLEALEARRLYSAASPPTVNFEYYVKGTGTSRTFAVYYDGVDSIDRTTLDGNDIRVFTDNDFTTPAAFVGMAKTKRGNGLIARYRADGLVGGLYQIEMGEGEVTDVYGAQVQPGVLGGFRIGRKGRTTIEDPHNQQRLTGASVRVVGTRYGPHSAPPAIDTSFGTVIGAVNFGGAAADVTGSTGVNVHFQSQLASSGTAATTLPFVVSLAASTATPSPGDLADRTVGSQGVYETEIYSVYGVDELLKVSGLDPAKTYRIQFLHGDSRVTSMGYASTPQSFFTQPVGFATTPLAFDTTTADAESNTTVEMTGSDVLTYRMPPSNTRGPSFSGMVVSVGGGPVVPQVVLPPASFVRSSVQMSGASQAFNLAFAPGSTLTAAGLAASFVTLSGPGGYEARAALAGVTFGKNGGAVATYKVDGIDVTGSYRIMVGGAQDVAKPTFFYLVPIKWETNVITVARRRHR
jgi:hypothetical protein